MQLIKSFSSYSLVAVISAVSDWLAFLAAYGIGVSPPLAQGLARIVGGTISFGMNRHLSFGFLKGHGLSRATRRFLILYAASYLISIIAFMVFLDFLNVSIVTAKLLADGTCFIFNFVVMRHYVFVARPGIWDYLSNGLERFAKSSE